MLEPKNVMTLQNVTLTESNIYWNLMFQYRLSSDTVIHFVWEREMSLTQDIMLFIRLMTINY